MKFKNVEFELTSYFLDENVPAIEVRFTNVKGKTWVDEIELPGKGKSMIYVNETKNGTIQLAEIVDPNDFLHDPALNDVKMNGYNVKELIMAAYRQFLTVGNRYASKP